MKRIILITGGARSGKSTYAEKLALELSPTPVYLATARIWDEEFRQRVIRHQERRGPEWTNIEEEKELSRHRLEGRVVLIDCITLWCTNFFFDLHSDTDRALAAAKAEFDCFTAQDATFIFVTNEIGMGGTSENELQRKFTDMQGWMNQYVAARADEVILMVSGIPLTVNKKEGMHEGMEGMGGAHSCCGGHTANGNQSAPAKDPVCGMSVDPATAAATREYNGTTYYFCNPGCAAKFEQNPTQYLA